MHLNIEICYFIVYLQKYKLYSCHVGKLVILLNTVTTASFRLNTDTCFLNNGRHQMPVHFIQIGKKLIIDIQREFGKI